MATQRIFLAEKAGLALQAREALAHIEDPPDLVALDDGAKCVGAFAKLAQAGKGPLLIILDVPLPRISGRGTAFAIRAIERALDLKPTAILFYAEARSDEDTKAFLGQIKRAVHLQRKPEQSDEDQAKRLSKAIDKLLAQVRA